MSDTPPPPPSDLPSSWKAEESDAARADRSGSRRWLLAGAVGLVLVAGIVAALVATGGIGPKERAWPAEVGGRPAGLGGEKETAAEVTPDVPAGVYLWQSFDGWHLWAVNGDGLDGLTGTITSSDDIVDAVSSAPNDGTVSVAGKTIAFDLGGSAAVAGVDFDPGFSRQLTFVLETADGKVRASQVFTGQDREPVDAVPVVIDKPVVD